MSDINMDLRISGAPYGAVAVNGATRIGLARLRLAAVGWKRQELPFAARKTAAGHDIYVRNSSGVELGSVMAQGRKAGLYIADPASTVGYLPEKAGVDISGPRALKVLA